MTGPVRIEQGPLGCRRTRPQPSRGHSRCAPPSTGWIHTPRSRTPSAIADHVQAIAAEVGATPAQVAIAWLLDQGRRHRRGTTLGELIGVAGRRWGIEEAFAITKSEAGLDEHQVRRWTAWYHYAILSMLAAAFLAVTRARRPANPPPGAA